MRRRLTTLAAGSHATAFLTLTASVQAHATPLAAFKSLRKAWPRLVQRMRRLRPHDSIEYLWVWETTRAGFPHLHVLLKAPFIPKRWLSRQWQELTGSPIVDIRRIDDSERAAFYVAKYLTKALNAPPGFRRWGSSAGFLPEPMRTPNPDKDPYLTWEWSPDGIAAIEAAWRVLFPASVAIPGELVIALSDVGASRNGVASLRRLMDVHPPPREHLATLNAFVIHTLSVTR